MMKITVRDVCDAHVALATHGGLSLPPALSLRFGQMTRAIRTEAETATDVRRAIVQKYAAKDDAGNIVQITLPGGMQDVRITDQDGYRKEIKELDAAPIEIPGDQFTLADLGDKPIHSDVLAGIHFAIKTA